MSAATEPMAPVADLDLAADQAIAACGGDAREAVKAQALTSSACLNVIQIGAAYPFSIAADHSIR